MPVQYARQSWLLSSAPATGVQATATKAAGAGTAKHVIRSIVAGFSAGAAIVASTITINVRDGISGAGTVLWSASFDLPAATVTPQTIQVSDVLIMGSAATAMTIEFVGLLANLRQFVNAEGYDTD